VLPYFSAHPLKPGSYHITLFIEVDRPYRSTLFQCKTFFFIRVMMLLRHADSDDIQTTILDLMDQLLGYTFSQVLNWSAVNSCERNLNL